MRFWASASVTSNYHAVKNTTQNYRPKILTQQCLLDLSSTHQFIHYRSLDWVEALQPDVGPLEALLQDEINPDIVLGADIVRFTLHRCRYHRFLQVFDPTLVLPLITLITLALRPGCSHKTQKSAIIALTVRNTETFQLFLNYAQGITNISSAQELPWSPLKQKRASYCRILH